MLRRHVAHRSRDRLVAGRSKFRRALGVTRMAMWTRDITSRYNCRVFLPLSRGHSDNENGRGEGPRRGSRLSGERSFPSARVKDMNSFVGKHVVSAVVAVLAGFALSDAQAADVVGNAKAGQAKVAMCIGCHGIADYRTAYPEVYQVPKLGGQNEKYLENALRGYRLGDARRFQTMHAIASSLTDQDIADIATYYAGQTSSSPDNPEK
jgi:cytochrome c553